MDAVHRDAQRLGCHLGENRIASLADLGFAGLKLDRAVLIEDHTAGGTFQGNRPHRCIIPKQGHSHTPPHRAGLQPVALPLAAVVNGLHSLVHHLVEGVEIVFIFGKFIAISHRHDLCPAKVHRVHVQGAADVVDVALAEEHGLRNAVASHGPGGRTVCKNGVAVALEVVAGIELGEGPQPLGADAVSVGGVGPLVGKELQLPRREGPVGADPRDDMGALGVADAVVDKGLLSGTVYRHRASAQLGGQPGAEGLVEGVLLVAKAAADIGLDHADHSPGDAKGLPHHAAHNMGNLGGGGNHDAASLHFGGTDVIFNVTVLHGRRFIPALDLNESRLLNRLLIVAPVNLGVGQDVTGVGVVELAGPLGHGLVHVQNHRVRLVFHLDEAQGLPGRRLVVGHHDGDVVPVVADPAGQQQPVGHVLMARVERPGVPRRGKGAVRDVEAGEHRRHPVHSAGLGHVDGLDNAVAGFRVFYPGNQGARGTEVGGVFGPPRRLIVGVDAGDAFAHGHGNPS